MHAKPFEVTVTQHDGYVVAALAGNIDESAKAGFDERLHTIIEVPGTCLILDLANADRITSAGINGLVTLVSRANTKGSSVVLVNANPLVSSIFAATKLTRFFDIEPTLAEGIARIRR